MRRPAQAGDDQGVEDQDDDERQETVGDEAQLVERLVHERDDLTVVAVLRRAVSRSGVYLERPEHVTAGRRHNNSRTRR